MGKYTLWLILSICCAVLYRLGGKTGWNTKYRDFGCPLLTTIWLLPNLYPISAFGWLMLGLAFLLLFGSLTTYFDWFFGYDNFYAHGYAIGWSAITLFWCGVHWWAILIRIVVLTLGMGLWHKWQRNATIEEFGRGFLIGITLPILTI